MGREEKRIKAVREESKAAVYSRTGLKERVRQAFLC